MENMIAEHMSSADYYEIYRQCNSTQLDEAVRKSSKGALSGFFSALPPFAIADIFELLGPESVFYALTSVSADALEHIMLAVGKRKFAEVYVRMSTADCLDFYVRLPSRHQKNLRYELEALSRGELLARLVHLDAGIHNEDRGNFDHARSAGVTNDRDQMDLHLYSLRQEINALQEANKLYVEQLSKKQVDIDKITSEHRSRENYLQSRIDALEKEQQQQLQEKIEDKVPKFVEGALIALDAKEAMFSAQAFRWNLMGSVAVSLAILAAIASFWFGVSEFRSSANESLGWLFFIFILFKGLIVISICSALAKHAYSVANAYVHESLKRSDRRHAINFGKLYLEIYGGGISQAEMKSAFENWNLDSDSAFVKMKVPVLDSRVVGQLTGLIEALSKLPGSGDRKKD